MIRWRNAMIFGPLVIALLAITFNPPPAAAQTQGEIIDEMLELSSIRQKIDRISVRVKSELDRQQHGTQNKLTPNEYDRISKILTGSFAGSDLNQSIASYFHKHYDQDRAVAELAILHSPANKRLRELMAWSSTPEARQKILAYDKQLTSVPPTPERMTLIRALDQASHSTAIAVEVTVSTSLAVTTILNALRPPDTQLNHDQLVELSSRMRKELWNAAEHSVIVTYLYAFRDISDAELKDFIALYKSDTAKWFRQVATEALTVALTTATEKALGQMAGMTHRSST